MTRLPGWDAIGVDGPPYELQRTCAAVHCLNSDVERHHVYRRSFLAGDYWWVKLTEGEIVGNCIPLCHHHHQLVTENVVEIIYRDGRFFSRMGSRDVFELNWQPPFFTSEEAFLEKRDSKLAQKETAPLEVFVCPTCDRPLPMPKIESDPEEKRVRKTWSIAVPRDEHESGAEVLDELLEAARTELARAGLPYGDSKTVRYFVLTTALALFVTHSKEITV